MWKGKAAAWIPGSTRWIIRNEHCTNWNMKEAQSMLSRWSRPEVLGHLKIKSPSFSFSEKGCCYKKKSIIIYMFVVKKCFQRPQRIFLKMGSLEGSSPLDQKMSHKGTALIIIHRTIHFYWAMNLTVVTTWPKSQGCSLGKGHDD